MTSLHTDFEAQRPDDRDLPGERLEHQPLIGDQVAWRIDHHHLKRVEPGVPEPLSPYMQLPLSEVQETHGHFHELMEGYDTENVDSTFWFRFAGVGLPPASYCVVAVAEPSARRASIVWVPKEVFHAISADFERRHRRGAR